MSSGVIMLKGRQTGRVWMTQEYYNLMQKTKAEIEARLMWGPDGKVGVVVKKKRLRRKMKKHAKI